MRLTVHRPAGAPLLTGVPFAPGALPADAGLALHDAGADSAVGARLPLWWEVRSRWPDGSARWVFVHGDLGAAIGPRSSPAAAGRDGGRPDAPTAGDAADGRVLDLTVVAPGTPSPASTVAAAAGRPPDLADGAAAPADLARGGVIQVGDTVLQVAADGTWSVTRGSDRLALIASRARVGDAEVALAAPVEVSLVEASPIAPLVRVRQRLPVATTCAGLVYDQLLRLTPGGLHWQQRVSFHTDQVQPLRGLTARLTVSGHDTAWHWPGLDPAPARRLLVPRPGRQRLDDGPETAGHPEARVTCGTVDVHLQQGWQRAPCALAVDGEAVTLELFPADVAALPVHPGTSFRHEVRCGLGGPAPAPVAAALDPDTACASGAFGPLTARTGLTEKRHPGYERSMDACMNHGRLSRLEKERGEARGGAAALADEAAQDEEYFGLQHYGDWPMALGAYGGERRMYADNEYDTPFAYWLQYARTGNTVYADVAAASAVHMADLDCKATDGDMLFHGYRDTADDHGAHRAPHGDLGHYWTDGMMLAWLLRGDLWAREAALGVAGFLCRRFAPGDDGSPDAAERDAPVRLAFLGCERAVGWPLVALAGVAEVDADPVVRQRMDAMVAYLARFTADPDRELEEAAGLGVRWWRICQQDGTKPFMLGVVMEGLERHHRLTGDPAAAQALVAIARFLVDVMWVEGIEAFIYEWNAFNRGHREESYPHYINLMVAPGLAYAYELSGERVFRDVATRAFHAALWTLWAPGGGKEIGMVGRTSSLMVARLQQWHDADQAARARRLPPSVGVAFRFAGSAGQLHDDARLFLREGTPRFVAGALVSAPDSYAVYSFVDRVGTDRGRLAFTLTPDWDCPPHPGPVAQRAHLHLCDRPFTASCVSVISFYTGLHVRFHDAERHYIEVMETAIDTWRAGQPHRIEVEWDTEAGTASLRVDGAEADRCALPRRLAGAFQHLHLGHRPGNWRADGCLTDLELDLG